VVTARARNGDPGQILATVLRGFRELVARLGGDAEALMRASGLEPALLDPLDRRLPFDAYAMLLERTASALDCPDFGMRLAGLQDGLSLMGPVGPALGTSPTIGEVYAHGSRHMHVYSSAVHTQLEHDDDGDQYVLRFEVLADGVPYRRQVMEQLVAIARDDAIALSGGRARPHEIWFAHDAHADAEVYLRRFGARVRFSEPYDALLFDADDIHCKVPAGDRAASEAMLAAILRRYPYQPRISARVRQVINRTLHDADCKRGPVAAALGLHPRTLHRRLRAEGKTFETIKDQVRRELAAHYLAESGAPLGDVAMRLGFADLATLSRACRRWFGDTPTELRRSHSFGSEGR
jgi:AraC-like DNA-binding protein